MTVRRKIIKHRYETLKKWENVALKVFAVSTLIALLLIATAPRANNENAAMIDETARDFVLYPVRTIKNFRPLNRRECQWYNYTHAVLEHIWDRPEALNVFRLDMFCEGPPWS